MKLKFEKQINAYSEHVQHVFSNVLWERNK